jgi:hypothetical protein
MKVTLMKLLSLYDNWNGNLIINNAKCDLYACVRFEKLDIWLNEYKEVMNAEVMAFGFYDNELCVRVNI